MTRRKKNGLQQGYGLIITTFCVMGNGHGTKSAILKNSGLQKGESMSSKIKYLIIGIILVFMSFGLAWLSYAQDPVAHDYGKDLVIGFDPSPSEGVVGHTIFYRKQGSTEEANSGAIDMPVTSFVFPADLFEPETTYEFDANAFRLTGDPSVRSEALIVNIGPLPPYDPPEPWLPPGQVPDKPLPPGWLKKQ
jgi:hypothetical protein